MLVKHTDIPLCTHNRFGAGEVVMLPFRLSALAEQYRLAEFFRLWSNLIDMLLGDARTLKMDIAQGIIASVYERGDRLLVHLVNGIGQRPLMNPVAYTDFSFRVAVPAGAQVAAVEGVLSDARFTWRAEEGALTVNVARLGLWEMFRIRLAERG